MSGSGLDTVLTALVAAFRTAAPVGAVVYDGEPSGTPPRQFLCVGHDESDAAAVQASVTRNDQGGRRYGQVYDVSCLLSCWEGKATGQSLRAETFALYDGFDAALAADRRLANTAVLAEITSFEYQVNRIEGVGVLGQVRFTVQIQSVR